MKNIFAIISLSVMSVSLSLGQNTTPSGDFFTPEPPSIQRSRFKKETEKQLDQIKILSRWYIGTDLYGRSDISTLDNNYRYLFTTTNPNNLGFSFSGQLGWIFREQFALEGGYARNPIHNRAILNTTNKGGFEFANSGHALFLRGKFLIEFEKMGTRRPGLWLGGGAWAFPGSGGTRPPKAYVIHQYNFNGNTDTTYVDSKTTMSDNWTYGLEASAEFAMKLNEWSDIAFFLRRNWGYGTAIETELTFADNKQINETGWIRSDGTGWSFGVSFRFMTGIRRGNYKGVREKDDSFSSPYNTRISP